MNLQKLISTEEVMWPNALIPIFGALGITFVASAPTSTQLLSIEVPSWAQISIVFFVIFLLLWLIVQSQSRYDKLLKRIDDNDVRRLAADKERIEIEKLRIIADTNQAAKIESLGRAVERLDITIKENTNTLISNRG